jgi:Zn-dependent alcohol dehydrogenase
LSAKGVLVILGLVANNDKVTFNPSLLLCGRTYTFELFGGYKRKTNLLGLVEKYTYGVR